MPVFSSEIVISIDEAREIVAKHVRPLPVTDTVTLPVSHGRMLRRDVEAKSFFPEADVSMMDGFAFRSADTRERFRIAGEVPAGTVREAPIEEGECVRIFTGGRLPPGADAVIPQEDTRVENGFMIPMQRSAKRWVRVRGSEGKPGQVIALAPIRLGGVEVAALAQAGCTHPTVSAALLVAHIATGDEIVDPMTEPGPGKIRDTNSSLLRGLVGELGGEFSSRRCGDDLAELQAAIPGMGGVEKLILISGGASVGAYDFGARALREAGFTIHFDKVNLRPGKPLTFATRGDQVAFVIPGNPVSHFVCFQTVIRLAIDRLQGSTPWWCFIEMLHGGGYALPTDARETFWPARVVVREGQLIALPKQWSSSGDTFSLVGTNALIRVPREGEAIQPGEVVRVWLLGVPTGE